MQPNPYQPPLTTPPESSWSEAMSWVTRESPDLRIERMLGMLHLAAMAYPMLLVGQFYGCWLLAWAMLGRPPRPSWDDPKDVLGWIYGIAGLLVPLMPAALFAALCSITLRLARSRSGPVKQIALVLLTLTLWISGWALLRWDPWRVVEWWID
jgi:hypothetical protein